MKEDRMKAQSFFNRVGPRNLRVPQIPLEWYGNNCWRLPSGQALAEFALQAGFLAPLLFKTDTVPPKDTAPSTECDRQSKEWKKASHS